MRWSRRADSNRHPRFTTPVLCPLSYKGMNARKGRFIVFSSDFTELLKAGSETVLPVDAPFFRARFLLSVPPLDRAEGQRKDVQNYNQH